MTTTPEHPAEPDPVAPGATPTADGAELAVGQDVAQDVLQQAADALDEAVERELEPGELEAMDALDTPHRLLLVHAHPDDETIATGATIAAAAAATGTSVTLVTCTRGERGEVLPSVLAEHPEVDADEEALAELRVQELAAAAEALGLEDRRLLGADATGPDGEPVRYRDSGMAWAPLPDGEAGGDGASARAVPAPDAPAGALSLAPLEELAGHLARVLREVRPQVVITYEPGGGYGHPDHVRAHELTLRAVEMAEDPSGAAPWSVARVLGHVADAEQLRAGLRELRAAGLATIDPDGALPSLAVASEEVDVVVDASAELPAKVAALRAHASQVELGRASLAMTNGLHQPLSGVESYRLLRGEPLRPAGGEPATDLFAGLA
ncbi:N-acetyl-1-D-myo-inositol-2-amino-2-deoxy-alpha-D-glucopyranoside deacetylase [uncultured Pseudokineococcus sp.]|uniref:N-acetyl-1-D-myo-inositol-2-amino-2-deoxy-alpha- D-glucopyranoside deacetylase n=1 Tax=uncultured Pseudokineococcus sp. TaxID=1642928 RepID=UPI002639B97A|nr:N-acetyl-1-D-myo-inositol-2-amino-2-deoxy-alpha-D-glucopyranoside deacetylase [uncultured Pseudokineococcus sp.]